ncbi:MAG: SDR family oxidoreductase [Mucilaginibacter polytrichastri]|nr:SDR family oxidoreductase [Mucilaginibacter polytrichastri]
MKNEHGYTLITGGTKGIGLELARLFAQEGHNLILVARTESDLKQTAQELKANSGVDVITIAKDLFDTENARALCREITNRNLLVNILVNDAGQGHYGKFQDNAIEDELAIVNLNISSLLILTKHFLKGMLARSEGKILNLSSIAGKVPGPYQAVYHGTKAFVQSFTEAIRSEVKDSGSAVTITALLPGATDTDFFNKAGMNASKIVQNSELDDAAQVAKDGYEALMAGKDKVISGFKNKAQVAMANITPDEMAANNMLKQQEPANK